MILRARLSWPNFIIRYMILLSTQPSKTSLSFSLSLDVAEAAAEALRKMSEWSINDPPENKDKPR